MSNYEQIHLDFALRTKVNLEYIEHAQQINENVFEITQLINSILGIIIFLREGELIPSISMENFCPEIKYSIILDKQGSCKYINQFLRRFRNAIAHCRITPYPKNGAIIYGFELQDKPPHQEIDWIIQIDVENIRMITHALIEHIIKESVPEHTRQAN